MLSDEHELQLDPITLSHKIKADIFISKIERTRSGRDQPVSNSKPIPFYPFTGGGV